jgi:hypothetical protein
MGKARTGGIVVQNGRMSARVTYVGEDGKRHAIWRAAKNRTHAKQLIPEILRILDSQRPGPYGGLRNRRRGFIYAVQMGIPSGTQPIKIGFAVDVADRVKVLLTSSPYPLNVIGFWGTANGHLEEKKLHEMFAGDRLQGEWFDPTEQLTQTVRERTNAYRSTLAEQIENLTNLMG